MVDGTQVTPLTHYTPRTQAFERLTLDGGWLTPAQLAMECDQSESTVYASLHRQVKAGWVIQRTVYLASGDAPDGFNDRDQARRSRMVNRRTEFRVKQ